MTRWDPRRPVCGHDRFRCLRCGNTGCTHAGCEGQGFDGMLCRSCGHIEKVPAR